MQPRSLAAALLAAAVCSLLAAGSSTAHTSTGRAAPSSQGAGADVPRGFTIVNSAELTAPAGRQVRGTATCPAGRVPLSGSAALQTASVLAGVNSSFPSGNGWAADVNNAGSGDFNFQVLVVCAFPPKHYSIVTSGALNDPADTQAGIVAVCPTGSKPLGGGVASGSGSVQVNINTTIPIGHAWLDQMNNASPVDTDNVAFVVCGKVAGYTVVAPAPVDNPAVSHTLSFAACPPGTVAIGGGGASGSIRVDVNLGGMGDAGAEVDSFMNNASSFDSSSSTVAICAS
jgi:hypothetical protein